MSAEADRLKQNEVGDAIWHRWGTFVSERQWGTVREDYSPNGTAWDSFPHDMARSRAYRWGEDGIAGWCDRHGQNNLAFAFWNGVDPILKERLFGLTNSEGNHGEDVKELYYFLDAAPTHSYMHMRYLYPQHSYPYNDLIQENNSRKSDLRLPEYELLDTGTFDEDRYFEIDIEYAKENPSCVLARVTITNRGPAEADIWVLPHVWFRNRWSWEEVEHKPRLSKIDATHILVDTTRYGPMHFQVENADELLFTENETNTQLLFGTPNETEYVKDAFHRYLIHGDTDAVNPNHFGTKACSVHRLRIESGKSKVVKIRLSADIAPDPFDEQFDHTFATRKKEVDEFYQTLTVGVDPAHLDVQRQAFAGILWSKQFYHYNWERWAKGDPLQPAPALGHADRNAGWSNFHAADVIVMPDTWEYPWFAAWDLAFHCATLAHLDPSLAKKQLHLLMREWYMHPSGQIPAYEWAFSDVNPPVQAKSALEIFQIDGAKDFEFLKTIFHKLLLNFTWWVNRKDSSGNNLFEGGFLGLDNIGLFDRNREVIAGFTLEQSDATSWMGMFCLDMLRIALILASQDATYQDLAIKFFEHFLYIRRALNEAGTWDEEDGFYYDVLSHADGKIPVKVRSMVGIIPLFAIATINLDEVRKLTDFVSRAQWFINHRPDLAAGFRETLDFSQNGIGALSLVPPERLQRLMQRVLDPNEFLSDYGIRGLSKIYGSAPYTLRLDGQSYTIQYEPGESSNPMFGGNSNWRGPIWFPLNAMLADSLIRHGAYLGHDFKIGGRDLRTIARDIQHRMIKLFVDEGSGRPLHGGHPFYQKPSNRNLVLFYEYFHGDTGRGCGASHQTGWTALVANLIQATRH